MPPGLPIPVVQTFHALGVVKARYQGAADTSPANRVELERRIALACDQVIATCRDEASELAGLGVPAWQISVVPCGVDTEVFTPDGPAARRNAPAAAAGPRPARRAQGRGDRHRRPGPAA